MECPTETSTLRYLLQFVIDITDFMSVISYFPSKIRKDYSLRLKNILCLCSLKPLLNLRIHSLDPTDFPEHEPTTLGVSLIVNRGARLRYESTREVHIRSAPIN